MLTREEVERRLADNAGASPDNFIIQAWNQALQTALAVMDERDEILTAKKRDSQMAIRYYSKYQEAIVERDALAAEGRLLREVVQEMVDCQHCIPDPLYSVPLIAAEVERVRLLEAVLEAAEAQDPPASANLARALAAYREGERPGGEV